jgi:hypothetical protein
MLVNTSGLGLISSNEVSSDTTILNVVRGGEIGVFGVILVYVFEEFFVYL